MTGTDDDGYRSAWRADHTRSAPVGDPWGAPIARPTPPDASPQSASALPDASPQSASALPDAAEPASPLIAESPPDPSMSERSPDPSTSDHPTAPWPFVATRAPYPEVAPAPLGPPWPGDLAEPPPAMWPPVDGPHESAPGVWSPPTSSPSSPSSAERSAAESVGFGASPTTDRLAPGQSGASVSTGRSFAPSAGAAGTSAPTAWPPSPPAWPQQSAPPTWPPLPDAGAGNEATAAASRRSSPSRPPIAQRAEPASEASGWAPATDAAAAGVYAPPAPAWPDPSWSPSPAGDAAAAQETNGWGSPAGSGGSGLPAESGVSGGFGLAGGSIAPPLDAPRGRRAGRRAIALGAVIALVVFSVVGVVIGTRSHGRPAGRSASSGPGPGASRGTAPSGSTSSGSTSGSVGAIALGDGRSLIARIVPTPAGAHSYKVGDSSAGIMTVTQYVRHYFNGAASELKRLQEEGFRVAASTDYVRSDGLEIATHLVQFTDTTGAQEYFDVEQSAWAAESGVTMFSVPARPDAVGYELGKVDSLGNRRTVMYEHMGNVVVVVNVYTPGKIDRAEDVKVLQTQLLLLG
jgi:hypothetical protein